MNNIGSEKRRHVRVSNIIMVDIYNYFSGKFISSGFITDICVGGMRVESNEQLDAEDEVLLKFILPTGNYFDNMKGKIVRTGKESVTIFYGISFLDISLLDKLRLWFYAKKMRKNAL